MKKTLTIEELINTLYDIMGNGRTKPDFFLDLITASTNEQNDSFFRKDANELSKILRRQRKVSKKSATYIMSNINKDGFVDFFYENISDSAEAELGHTLESFIGTTNSENIATKVFELLLKSLKTPDSTQQSSQTQQTKIYSNNDIEDDLAVIVKTIASLTEKEVKDILTYEPYNVDKKISPENGILLNTIKNDVNLYYTKVEELFKEIDSSKFDNFAISIKNKSDKLIENGLSQEAVFYNMIAFLKTNILDGTNVSDTACRIVISFFVQNCEVFHEIS